MGDPVPLTHIPTEDSPIVRPEIIFWETPIRSLLFMDARNKVLGSGATCPGLLVGEEGEDPPVS